MHCKISGGELSQKICKYTVFKSMEKALLHLKEKATLYWSRFKLISCYILKREIQKHSKIKLVDVAAYICNLVNLELVLPKNMSSNLT